jgi:hypothetical protein
MTGTENINLVVSFKLAGERGFHFCGATRIKVDGHGGLTVYSAENGPAEKFQIADVQSFAIQPVSGKAA